MKRPSDMTLGAILLVLGAIAGVFLGRFTSHLKPEKLVMQWDIGNTFVGVATTIVAFTSIWIALTNKRRDGIQKIADYRMQWIEGLRGELADLCSIIKSLGGTRFLILTEKDRKDVYHEMMAKATKLQVAISIRLSENEKLHVDLMESIRENILSASEFTSPDINKEEQIELHDKFIEQFKTLVTLSRQVTKYEWRRVKTEVKEGT